MNWNRIQAKDLKDALDELSVSVKPEEHQMLEKTLDVDGIYNKYKLVFWIKIKKKKNSLTEQLYWGHEFILIKKSLNKISKVF